MSHTKDELFLIAIYRHYQKTDEPDEPFDPGVIGKTIGYNPTSCNSMAKMLHRANFLRKKEEGLYTLSPFGEQLARSLLNE